MHTVRLEEQECKVCYYCSKIGGTAMTFIECSECGKQLNSCNTNIDIICKDCAKKMKVCKHCGADMNEKNRKKLM